MPLYDHKDAENPVLPEGEYDALIDKSESYTSKAGAEMRKLKVIVYHDGREIHLFDYISMAWKYKNLAELTGQLDVYKLDEFDPNDHCEGVNCRVKLNVKEDPQYGKQNQISKYIRTDTAPAPKSDKPRSTEFAKRPAAAPKPEDIDVPF